MLYETIDAGQIDDIMAGREPREPKDWGGTDSDAVSEGHTGAAQDGSSSSPIGGPAGEH